MTSEGAMEFRILSNRLKGMLLQNRTIFSIQWRFPSIPYFSHITQHSISILEYAKTPRLLASAPQIETVLWVTCWTSGWASVREDRRKILWLFESGFTRWGSFWRTSSRTHIGRQESHQTSLSNWFPPTRCSALFPPSCAIITPYPVGLECSFFHNYASLLHRRNFLSPLTRTQILFLSFSPH